jgi:hypothetical protein
MPVFQKIVPNLNLNKIDEPEARKISSKFQQYQS